MKSSNSTVFTKEENCMGCNKCIEACPALFANIAYKNEKGENKIYVNDDACIKCGHCLDVCDHNARDFKDDTEEFFNDLRKGHKISVVAAPAVRFNFHNYKKVFGFLKSAGVNLIYDVSFGADICTWAYLKAIKENNLSSVIAQPCPAIVNYVEKYRPELTEWLAPIHSPTLCTAVYLRKYANSSDKIAFLSPCLGKDSEFEDKNTHGLVTYNVTYKKLKEYMERHRINAETYQEVEFDDMGCALGLTFCRPGGLRENVEFVVPNAWIRQIEGKGHAYEYLDEYAERVADHKKVPLLVDILNCKDGCTRGTATCKDIQIDDIDCGLNKLKADVIKNKANKGIALFKKKYPIFEYFDKNLNLGDFVRYYDDKSYLVNYKQPSPGEMDAMFENLHKNDEQSRHINCSACGYGSCEKMARAIYNDVNVPDNCIYYNRIELQMEKDLIAKKNEEIHEMVTEIKKISAEKEKEAEIANRKVSDLRESSREIVRALGMVKKIENQTVLLSLNAAVEAARAGEAGKSFGVVADEVKKLANQSANVTNQISELTERIQEILE
jgi:Na+-translocating ferredoxin:NAD+ oxidoreductase RNF subunit RnfB